MKKLFLFAIICFVVGIIGRLLPYGNSNWNFLFENMIWFPIEVVITILVLDKIISERDDLRDKKRFIKSTMTANPNLIESLKRSLAGLSINDIVYDPDRSNEYIFKDTLENPQKHFTDSFFNSMRTFHFIGGTDADYNYAGFAHYYCQQMYDSIQKYLDRYQVIIDDDVLELLVSLQDLCNVVGMLQHNNPIIWTSRSSFHMDDDAKNNVHKLYVLTDKLEKVLDELSNVDSK